MIAAMAAMILCIIGFVIIIVGGCIKIFDCVRDGWNLTPFIFLSMIFTCLPALICGAVIVGKINSYNFDLSPLAEPGCTDSITQGAISGFTSKISSAKSMAAAYLSFSIFGILAGVSALLFE